MTHADSPLSFRNCLLDKGFDLVRHWQAGMGGMGEIGRGVEARDRLRIGHVGDVENEEAVMPIAHIQTIADADRMVASGRRPIVPRIGLAAGLPLPGNPPTPNLFGFGRVRQIKDHDDIADITFHLGRDIGVVIIGVEAVGAEPVGFDVAEFSNRVKRNPSRVIHFFR